jgi:hypothetical protein
MQRYSTLVRSLVLLMRAPGEYLTFSLEEPLEQGAGQDTVPHC